MDLSKLISCRHCGNISKMEIIGSINDDHTESDPELGPFATWGTCYSVLKCPACEKINVVSLFLA